MEQGNNHNGDRAAGQPHIQHPTTVDIRDVAGVRRIDCSLYSSRSRPPSTNTRNSTIRYELADTLTTLIVNCNDSLVLCGDLNCGDKDGGLDDRLQAVFDDLGFTQHITEPTRENRLLDVIATDKSVRVEAVRVEESLSLSDHRHLTAQLLCPVAARSTKVQAVKRQNLDKLDIATFEAQLGSSSLFTSPATDVDEFADQIEREITAGLNLQCPLQVRRRRLPRHRRLPPSPEATVAKPRRRRLERR